MAHIKIKELIMKHNLQSNANAVFSLNYHLIIIVKYWKKVFTFDDIVNRTKQIICESITENNANVINMECGDDHIHILFSGKPTTNITKLINVIKGRSSRLLRKEFKDFLRDKLYDSSFWSSSYYLATTGNVSLNKLIDYINNQRKGM